MAALINPLIKVFQTSDYIMNMVLGDVSNNDALKRVRGTEGSSVTWIVGHLCSYRVNIMKMFGSDKQNDFEEFYYKNGATDGAGYPEISDVLKKWNDLSIEFYDVMKNVVDDQLLKPEKSNGTHNEKTVLDTLTFLNWHEAYHMGVIGMIRKEFGYPGTADLAVAASKN